LIVPRPKDDFEAQDQILASIYKHGREVFDDISHIITSKTFTSTFRQDLYLCFEEIFKPSNNEVDENNVIDLPLIQQAAKNIKRQDYFHRSDIINDVRDIASTPTTDPSNIKRIAAKIRKLEIARILIDEQEESQNKLGRVTGQEDIPTILSIAEDPIFNFYEKVFDLEGAKLIGENAVEHLEHLRDNPQDQAGISTGFKEYDRAIGGGLRDGSVDIIGARMKQGKTTLALNMCKNMIGYEVPVLFVDTEMDSNPHLYRLLASITGVETNLIETGHFADNPEDEKLVFETAKKLEKPDPKYRYYYKSVAGMAFEEQMSIMRRWLIKDVGLDEKRKAKTCVIIYDWIKVADKSDLSSSIHEHQLLGFMLSTLNNFAVKYSVPILALLQLNRDGIRVEDTDAVAGSDRLGHFCSSLTFLKPRLEEEEQSDPPDSGNKKLVPIVCRYGPGLDHERQYIRVSLDGKCARMEEHGKKENIVNQPVEEPSQEDPGGRF
jgi:replicative DNA helicase